MGIATVDGETIVNVRADRRMDQRQPFDANTLHLMHTGVAADLARITHHDNLMTLAHIDTDLRWVYEVFSGQRLYEILHPSTPLPLERKSQLISDICHGVIALHAENLIHRDIKPHNIWTAEETKVGDFKSTERAGVTQIERHVQLRSVNWAAPEQQNIGEPVAPTMDVYSLGLVSLFILTDGAFDPAFHLKLPQIRAYLTSEHGEGAAAAILKAINPEPSSRQQTVTEFLTAISSALQLQNALTSV